MREPLHFRLGVGNGHGQPRPLHEDPVGEVVAEVSDLFIRESGLGLDLFVQRQLFRLAHVDEGHVSRRPAQFGGFRDPAADHPGLDTAAIEPLQGDSVLRIETFGLPRAAVGARQVKDLSIRQDAIDVHQDETDARGARAQLSGRL